MVDVLSDNSRTEEQTKEKENEWRIRLNFRL